LRSTWTDVVPEKERKENYKQEKRGETGETYNESMCLTSQEAVGDLDTGKRRETGCLRRREPKTACVCDLQRWTRDDKPTKMAHYTVQVGEKGNDLSAR